MCSQKLRSTELPVNCGICIFAPRMSLCREGDYDEDDDDDDSQENAGGATEEEVRNPRACLSFSIRLSHVFSYTSLQACFGTVLMCFFRFAQTNHSGLLCFYSLSRALRKFLGSFWMLCWRAQEHGRLISELFQRLPSKVVVLSISFQHVHKRIILLLL